MSVLLHAGALVVLLGLQFGSGIEMPVVASPLPAFVVAPNVTPPVVTPPTAIRKPVTTAPMPNPAIAPTVAADRITDEPANPAVFGPPPPSLTVVGRGGGLREIASGPGITLTAPPPARQGPVRIGGEIQAPARLVYVPPVYPTIAVTARVEGEVTLEATIDEAGAVQNVVVRHSVPLLDRAAIEAVSKWRYSPTRLNGQPVAVIMLVRVKFTMK
jgi:protein TonB